MAVLVDIYEDILTKAREKLPGFLTFNVWNNQTNYEADGKYPAYPKPALFVECVKNPDIGALPDGVSASDVAIVFHIVDEFYQADGVEFERNLRVMRLCNDVQQAFTLHKPPGCGHLVLFNEAQDQDHTQIYEYVLGFVAHFIDTAGQPVRLNATMPADLQATVMFSDPKNYIIPKP